MVLTSLISSVDVLVIGAGPTGLGAAKRLHQIVCPAAHQLKAEALLIRSTERTIMDDH